ncbi:hypothetical protein AB0945_41385 [Streptomyces sp. NPDC005474]|uniref:hypothetical protein n=1 Tax=Streptomyces sp. NPDC005474 TaxID=3154878 RepID=UPI003452385B
MQCLHRDVETFGGGPLVVEGRIRRGGELREHLGRRGLARRLVLASLRTRAAFRWRANAVSM